MAPRSSRFDEPPDRGRSQDAVANVAALRAQARLLECFPALVWLATVLGESRHARTVVRGQIGSLL